MTIRKQFYILALILLAIPVTCVIFVTTYRYVKSPERYMENGFKEIKDLDLSEKDIKTVEDNLKLLPPDIETAIIEDSGHILYSTMEEFQADTTISKVETWRYFNDTSSSYFYQFTALDLELNKSTILISRIDRDKKKSAKKSHLMTYLLIFLFCIVCFCVMFIALLSKNIFDSIIIIKNQTDQISNGDINTPITRKGGSVKLNEITSILQSLENMRISLLEVQNRKSKFIMGISHDLRTPVAIIKGYIEALKDGVITDKKEIIQTYDLIEGKTERLETMINTLINYMKLNDNDIREQLIPSSISRLIIDFSKEAEITGTIYKRKVVSKIDLPVDIEIPLDKNLVNRAFENIFSNAIRYTEEGDQITLISFIDEENNIIFKIQDDGIGIAKKDLDHIFELFYRGTNSRREEGMGIGLSVVKNIIDTHQWKINVESEKNKGTTFIIKIPVKTK